MSPAATPRTKKPLRPLKLRQASAFYRVAAKKERAGDSRGADSYRRLADRLVADNRRDAEKKALRKATEKP